MDLVNIPTCCVRLKRNALLQFSCLQDKTRSCHDSVQSSSRSHLPYNWLLLHLFSSGVCRSYGFMWLDKRERQSQWYQRAFLSFSLSLHLYNGKGLDPLLSYTGKTEMTSLMAEWGINLSNHLLVLGSSGTCEWRLTGLEGIWVFQIRFVSFNDSKHRISLLLLVTMQCFKGFLLSKESFNCSLSYTGWKCCLLLVFWMKYFWLDVSSRQTEKSRRGTGRDKGERLLEE